MHKQILEDDNLDTVTKLKRYFTVKSDLYATISGDHYRLMFASVPSLVDQVMRTVEKRLGVYWGNFFKKNNND